MIEHFYCIEKISCKITLSNHFRFAKYSVFSMTIAYTIFVFLGCNHTTSATSKNLVLTNLSTVPVVRIIGHNASSSSTGLIECNGSEGDSYEIYESVLARELSIYTKTLLKSLKIRKFILCSDLRFDGMKYPSLTDFENNVLYFDITSGVNNKEYQIKIIHHEIFHIIDYRDDGLIYSDPNWQSLNVYPYNRRGENGNTDDVNRQSDLTGFTTVYSTWSVEEDKAETFSLMITRNKIIMEKCLQDQILLNKCKTMRSILTRFSNDFDSLLPKIEEFEAIR